MSKPTLAATLYDALGSFGGGVNAGDSPLDLAPNVMAGSINTTVRGKYVTHRPAYWKRVINFLPTPPPSAFPPVNQIKTPSAQVLQFTEASFTVPSTGNSITLNVVIPYYGNIGDSITLYALALFTAMNANSIGVYTVTGFTPTTITLLCTIESQNGSTASGSTSPLLIVSNRSLGPIVPNPYVLTPVQTAAVVQGAVQGGVFQGACFASDDAGNASLVAFISQRVFQFLIQGNALSCSEIFVYPNGPITPIQPQAWLWQSERWVIIQDGVSLPIFIDLNGGLGITPVAGVANFGIANRSLGNSINNFATQINNFTVPAVNATATATLNSAANVTVGMQFTILGAFGGVFEISTLSGLNVTVLNVNDTTDIGSEFTSPMYWTSQNYQMPAGMMGAYGLGRNWIALPAGLQFVASDIVDGASGTSAYGFRDAVLNMTENTFITGGGAFSIPASGGETIQAIMFLSTLNVALGQGPVQVFTNFRVFSCAAPVDRTTWQTLTNPILTVSLIGAGAEGQNSTVMANGDPLFRALDGVRSLTFSTINFYNPQNLWSNVPISFEVSPTLANDNSTLLQYGSAIVFDNRLLMTCNPVINSQGVFFPGIVPINFDTVSTIKGAATPVWDSGVWNGMNVLQLVAGEAGGLRRAFSFCLNTSSPQSGIEVYEILPSTGPMAQIADYNGTASVPITWQFDSPSLRFKVPKDSHIYMHLSNGEIWVDQLIGTVNFTVQYKPDQFPLWTTWLSWQSCQTTAEITDGNPGFLPRQGLGEPSPTPCDTTTNRPMRNGFTFQTRNIITGHVVFLGAFYESQTEPLPNFAKISCPIPITPMTAPALQQFCGNYGGTTPNFIPPNVSCAVAWDFFYTNVPSMWVYGSGKWTQITQGY